MIPMDNYRKDYHKNKRYEKGSIYIDDSLIFRM